MTKHEICILFEIACINASVLLLPIHCNPVASSVLPDVQRHTKDPGLFRQSPFTHGLDKHSLTSGREQNGGEMSGLTLRDSFAPPKEMFGEGISSCEHGRNKRGSISPSQTSVWVSKRYPVGQWQLKLPGVFLHRPLSHSSLFTRHSSMSGRSPHNHTLHLRLP